MIIDAKRQIVPVDENVRLKIRDAARRYAHESRLLAPQSLEHLTRHARRVLERLELTDAGFEDFAVIMLNNALWERCFAHIPREQRLLLLPFCLRNQNCCHAPRDDLGLLCTRCGGCDVPALTDRAEGMEMSVLIAESSSSVAEWVERGDIQAVVGVSCFDSLRKAFPAMLRHAVPGIAVPLTKDGCRDTEFDRAFLDDALAISDDLEPFAAPHAVIAKRLDALFTAGGVGEFLHAATSHLRDFPKDVVHSLCAHGKHYRPMIVYGSFCAITNRSDCPAFLDPIALAVECFHKASLIHDDIEDDDATRYDEPALHRRIGTPAALNLGDFLIGEGYRLLAHPSIPVEFRAELMTQAARAHGELSLGQAQEFELCAEGIPLDRCLETHRLKTAPAFRVALYMGAIAAGMFEEYRDVFHEFANRFGVAYQLQDDLEDDAPNPASAVDCLMRGNGFDREAARTEITRLYESYRAETYDLLERIDAPVLKIFLYRLAGKVLRDV